MYVSMLWDESPLKFNRAGVVPLLIRRRSFIFPGIEVRRGRRGHTSGIAVIKWPEGVVSSMAG